MKPIDDVLRQLANDAAKVGHEDAEATRALAKKADEEGRLLVHAIEAARPGLRAIGTRAVIACTSDIMLAGPPSETLSDKRYFPLSEETFKPPTAGRKTVAAVSEDGALVLFRYARDELMMGDQWDCEVVPTSALDLVKMFRVEDLIARVAKAMANAVGKRGPVSKAAIERAERLAAVATLARK